MLSSLVCFSIIRARQRKFKDGGMTSGINFTSEQALEVRGEVSVDALDVIQLRDDNVSSLGKCNWRWGAHI